MAAEVLFENDRVRVTRVRHEPGEAHAVAARNDRLIIPLRESGDAPGSGHRADDSERPIDNSGGDMLIVEFKGETVGRALTPIAPKPPRISRNVV